MAKKELHAGKPRKKINSNAKAAMRNFSFKQQNGACVYCGEQMRKMPRGTIGVTPGDVATLEHVLPVSLGGTYIHQNIVVAHYSCNLSRQSKLLGLTDMYKIYKLKGPKSLDVFFELYIHTAAKKLKIGIFKD